jgi:pimeloyl-ACP methyl ester carboxylesterase
MNARSRTISTEDGRKIRINEAGQPHGVPVLALRGSPHSQLLYDRWVEDAKSRGIRLICYERQGYGASTPHPGRTVASAAKDVAAVAKELGLNRLFAWGVSGGGSDSSSCSAHARRARPNGSLFPRKVAGQYNPQCRGSVPA